MTMKRRRRKGTGGLYQRADGRWTVIVGETTGRGGPRRRRAYTSARFCDALRELSEVRPLAANPEPLPRALRIEASRVLGTHTAAEWNAKAAALDWRCTYCGYTVRARMTKDHLIPVSRGGSDAIDNITVACLRCNSMKHDMTYEEFTDYLKTRGPLPAPNQRAGIVITTEHRARVRARLGKVGR